MAVDPPNQVLAPVVTVDTNGSSTITISRGVA